MPHVVNCIAFYSLDFTNICFKYHERKKPVHTFCTPIFHGILKCDKVCSCIAALHHLLVLVLNSMQSAGVGEIPRYLTEPELRCTPLFYYPTHGRQSAYKSRPLKANHARPFSVICTFQSMFPLILSFCPILTSVRRPCSILNLPEPESQNIWIVDI